tara:strand:- start:249 stop:512 length:264 start_codon:yes stop_codon:yes gene_type:complete
MEMMEVLVVEVVEVVIQVQILLMEELAEQVIHLLLVHLKEMTVVEEITNQVFGQLEAAAVVQELQVKLLLKDQIPVQVHLQEMEVLE